MEKSFIIFRVLNYYYGLPIEKVSEVIQYRELTPIPFAPGYLRGFLNLRKEALAVIDLAVIFFNQKTHPGKTTSIMVSHIENQGQKFQIGILVDEVLEVLPIYENNIQEVKEIKENVQKAVLLGIVENQGKFIVLLNLDKTLDFSELKQSLLNLNT